MILINILHNILVSSIGYWIHGLAKMSIVTFSPGEGL